MHKEDQLMYTNKNLTICGILWLGFSILIIYKTLLPYKNIKVQKSTIEQLNNKPLNLNTKADLKITAYVTGWVKAPANILINQDSLNLGDELRKDQWVPSIAYIIRHSSFGVVILDTGLRAGNCDYGLRPFYWVPCRNSLGSDLVSRLIIDNIKPQDIRYIIPSHFHGDHISGLENLVAYTDAPLLITSAALGELRSPLRSIKGIPSALLGFDLRVDLMDIYWKEDALLGESLDVFKDGSLKIFKTSGHTDDHISALVVTKQKTVLLTFDVAHLKVNYDLGIPSGSLASQKEALDSLNKIKQLASKIPNLTVVFGHEPSQWECKKNTLEFNVLGNDCIFFSNSNVN